MIGGVALIVAAVGAATAGQTVSAAHDVAPASAEQHNAHVASLSGTSLESRDAARASRSGARPSLARDASGAGRPGHKHVARLSDAAGRAKSHAQQLANKRRDRLRAAASRAKSYAQQLANDQWVLPTSDFHISTWFGEPGPYWSSGYHTGIDFATAYGTPTVAVANARIVRTGWDGPYGSQVRLELENGDQVWYNHLSSIDVRTGQAVARGQQVGRVGDTGNSYGAHVHFEYRLASNLHDGVDPRPYFLEHGIRL